MKERCDDLTQNWRREIAAKGKLEVDIKPLIL